MADEEIREGKPRSRGLINPSAIDMIPRHVGRIDRLRMAIDKAKDREQPERVASLEAELNRRLGELAAAKDHIDAALSGV
jgi:hypothetical protein